jgi:hypothetical protein
VCDDTEELFSGALRVHLRLNALMSIGTGTYKVS